MPAPLRSRTKLQSVDVPYWRAFHSLHAARPHSSAGPAPIAVSEVLAYCELVGIASVPQRVKYLRLMQRLDAVYFDHRSAQAANQAT